ncbi:hypothetical protein ACHAWF_017877 [Thalassiosira exigua]
MASSQTGKSALGLKNEGNSHFVKRRFKEALACYSAGLKVAANDDSCEADVADIEATLYSNRSGCYYEMGDYENAAADARKCCQLLMESMGRRIKVAHDHGIPTPTDEIKLPPLVWKNWWRLARALHFSNAEDSEVHYALHVLEKQDEDECFKLKASKMREHLNYYRNTTHPKNENFQPTLLRASFQNPYIEYYNFGHDVSESLLQPAEDSGAQSIHLDNLDDDEISSLSFLFGGVGDARHAMATLLDAHHQYKALPEAKQERFRLHMTLNDISAQLLAKDALVLVLAYEIGQSAANVKEALKTSRPFAIGMIIYYVTLGYVMPPFVHEKMVEYIKLWFTENTKENFLCTFPWLTISEDSWEGILEKMNAWLEPEKHYSPHIHSVEEILAVYKPSSDNAGNEAMSGLSMMGASNSMMSDMKAKMDNARDQRRAVIKEQIRTMELSEGMVKGAKDKIGEDATEEQIRDFLTDLMQDAPDNPLEGMYVTNMDKLFLEETKCLYPQPGPVDEINEELSSFILEENSNKKDTSKAIRKYEPHIWKNWVTNPVQIDPLYHSYVDGDKAPDAMNPVKEFPQGYYTEQVISFMSEPPPTILDAKTEEEKTRVYYSNALAFNLIRYYWHVGKALDALAGKVVLEVDLGSILSLGASSSYRESNCLPNKFQRITLSNIPDYSGMLSVFITLAPMLASKSKSITPCFQSNTLLNTGIWKSYDDYVFSTVSLSYKEAEAMFRLRVTDDEPSTWGPFTIWEQMDTLRDEGLPLPHQELRTWIHRLYLLIILPADRDVNSMIREEKPSNVNLFLQTLSHCVKHLDIPAHFIASILEDLLKNKTLAAKAYLSNESPASALCRISPSKKSYNISAFHTELANQTAFFLQNNLLGFRILDTNVLPGGKASQYELKLCGISPKYHQSWAYTYGSVSSAMSMGFILQKEKESEYSISTGASNSNGNPMLMMMSMMGGGGGMSGKGKSSKLRQALLSSGDKAGHVFSCMQWNLETQTVTFWMCEDAFEQFQHHYLKLIRTDGWFILPHNTVMLGDAKRIIA